MYVYTVVGINYNISGGDGGSNDGACVSKEWGYSIETSDGAMLHTQMH